MGLIIFIILVGIPILEIAVFIEVGDLLGMWETIAIVFITAIIGASLMRKLGLQTLSRARQNLENNIFPAKEVFDGLCLVIAGALLLTPGFITDSVGFLLFLPPVRMAIGAVIINRLSVMQASKTYGETFEGTYKGTYNAAQSGFNSEPNDSSTVVDGDFRDISDPLNENNNAEDPSSKNPEDPKHLEHSDKS